MSQLPGGNRQQYLNLASPLCRSSKEACFDTERPAFQG